MEGGTLSKHGRDQLQQLYSHELQNILKLLSNTCCNKIKFSKRQNARQVVLCNDGIHRWQRRIFFQFKIHFSFPRYFVVRTYALNITLMQTSEIRINTFLRGEGDSEADFNHWKFITGEDTYFREDMTDGTYVPTLGG